MTFVESEYLKVLNVNKLGKKPKERKKEEQSGKKSQFR